MIALAVVPFVLSVVLWRAAPTLARWCGPAWAARGLVVLALVTSLGTGLVLCVTACLGIAELPQVARFGDWSAGALSSRTPVPAVVGVLAGAVAATLLGAAVVHVVRFGSAVRDAEHAGRLLGRRREVVVVDAPVGAYAVAGRTVVSARLLRELDVDERRAVLAHERSHLRHRHVYYVQLAELAAAANPLLRPAAVEVRRAVEAWADADAARTVRDPVCVARALAKAALSGHVAPAGTLAISGSSDVSHRVRLLLDPAPVRTRRALAVVAALAVCVAASSVAVGVRAHDDFEVAQSVPR